MAQQPQVGQGPTHRPLLDNPQHSQEADTHAPGGIRTYNPSKPVAADPRHRRAASSVGIIKNVDHKTTEKRSKDT
jgi:hypothetical protein